MTIIVPDIDLENATLEQLKVHANLCAHAENELRAHTLDVNFKIIKRVNELNQAGTHYVTTVRKPVKTRTVKDILGDTDLSELLDIDSFK